jgi:hypothetical protein
MPQQAGRTDKNEMGALHQEIVQPLGRAVDRDGKFFERSSHRCRHHNEQRKFISDDNQIVSD